MNAGIKKAWLEALRSGRFRQGRGRLHKVTPEGHEFCCLGVLCELYGKCNKKTIELAVGISTVAYDNTTHQLPLRVMEWSELENSTGAVPSATGVKRNLADLNDTGSSFAELADVIEGEL